MEYDDFRGARDWNDRRARRFNGRDDFDADSERYRERGSDFPRNQHGRSSDYDREWLERAEANRFDGRSSRDYFSRGGRNSWENEPPAYGGEGWEGRTGSERDRDWSRESRSAPGGYTAYRNGANRGPAPRGNLTSEFGRNMEYTTAQSFAGRGPRGYRRADERICEDVNEYLTRDYRLDASDITVHVENCEVTLEGEVETRQDKRLAEEIAENVSGVNDVHNKLKARRGILAQMFGKADDSDDLQADREIDRRPDREGAAATSRTGNISTSREQATVGSADTKNRDT